MKPYLFVGGKCKQIYVDCRVRNSIDICGTYPGWQHLYTKQGLKKRNRS